MGNIQFVPGVVARLRLVFLSVSLVLISAMLLGYLQIRSLNKTTDVLTEASVPVFVRTQEIERSLRRLVLSLQSVESVRDVDDLQALEGTLEEQLRILKLNIEKLVQHNITPATVVNMAEALKRLEGHVEQMLSLEQEILFLDSSISQAKNLLNQRLAAAQTALKELSNDAAVLLGEGASPGPSNADSFLATYSQNLRQANTLAKLPLELESLVELAVRLDRIPELKDAPEIENEMRSSSQEVLLLIDQVRPYTSQQMLAEETNAIHEIIFEDAGIFDQALQIQAHQSDLNKQKAISRELISEISANSDDLVLAARTRVNDATQKLGATANRVIMFLVMASLAAMLVFGFANVLIVEKQINQRMSRLTKAVTAIAANETDYDVDVEGNDELGEMAHALETFKSTAEELRRSNTELEKFAYVAAHDLRSPLRAIQDLAEWTIEDSENQFSADGRENMHLLQKRVDRLNRLLSDLLTYSRVGKESQDRTQISLPQIIQETREMLDPNDHHKISYSGIKQPVITFATPLRQVLLNLISNGIKHHDTETGTIKVAGKLTDGRLHISVEDDGPGIERQYHDRIFGLFQTLRPRDEVEGSGLGLAIVRKQVDHYGGNIRLTSNPETSRGTKFDFDMPANLSATCNQNLAA
ncbi:ATP-binding protein [uncultured Roseovarius sp.]|uniref:sensor histidine kinase n=1 Tax=uncultured Roseovarius sp. TaxID=293344 RepID=UPI002632FE77|nr:ATP-binding protein [uncultured Roseovarius sp.]